MEASYPRMRRARRARALQRRRTRRSFAPIVHVDIAKRRLFHALDVLKLPIESRAGRSGTGLVFSFMKDGEDGTKVFTGHSDELITINIDEAGLRQTFRSGMRRNQTVTV
jgi:hypothetical protein